MTIPLDLFRGSKLKIKRAYQHIDELGVALDEFTKTDFYSFGVKQNPETGQHFLQFKMDVPAPEPFPLIIGDALHNLRTALDYMNAEIVRRGNGTTQYVKFPVKNTRKEVISALEYGDMKVASKRVKNAIVDRVRPYREKGGDRTICALHDMDIQDKHILLTPIVSVAGLAHADIRLPGATFKNCTLTVGEGGQLNLVGMPGPFEFDGQGTPIFDIFFDKGPLEGQPVIPTLVQLAQFVARTLETIEKQFLARS